MQNLIVHQQRRGVAVVWTAVSLTMLFGFAALAVDGGYLYNVKADLQNAADAAALAAAITMFDDEGLNYQQAKMTALRVAARNLDVSPETAAHMMDFAIGRYENAFDHTQKFIAVADNSSNACRVVLHRTEERGQPARVFFSAIWGRNHADVSVAAVAGRAYTSGTPVVPVALREPNFGTVDPNVLYGNPGKDGPSRPANGEYFQLDEEVTVLVFGNGSMSNVHLTLDIEEWSGVASTNFVLGDNSWKIEQGGLLDQSLLTIGDQLYVENEGTGNSNFGIKLEDRIQDDNPLNNTVVLPIIRELWDSRDADGRLAGRVEVVDFVGIHLDRREEVVVVSADGQTNVVETLVGHVVRTTAHGVLSLEPGGYSEGLFTPILLR